LTDTAGQEEYRSLWAASNLHSEAFLLVYDITNPDSLYALNHFLDLIEMETETRADASTTSKPNGLGRDKNGASTLPPVKIIAGNKCDLIAERKVPAREGLEFARKRGCGFMETSARNVVNVEETFARQWSPPISPSVFFSVILTPSCGSQ
jgi:GTPase KRas protein